MFCKNRNACADPDIFFRGGGGGGGSGPDGQKIVWTTFFIFITVVLNLFYNLLRGSNGFITEKTTLFQKSRGGPTFSRGGGVLNANFY